MKFSEFNLQPDLERGLSEAGYLTCMPVQEQVLKNAFGGHDLYVQSQTGTGKTAAFLVVIFQRLLTEAMLSGKKAIIMVPTRELAVQVEEEAKLLGKYLPFKTGSFFGGVGYAQQTKLLRDNAQILVGTPGRVLDLNQSGQMNLMDIAFLVLDEADRMFDMGFYPDLRKLIRVVPPADRRQTMLFSATLNAWVKNLAWEYTKNPFEIAIEPETVTVDEVEQVLYHVSSADKMKLLLGILRQEDPESALVFCNTKRYSEIVAKRLRLNGFKCEFIMGDLPQTKRLKVIDDIKTGKLRLLVATDVAARGLDIEGLPLVVNYDLPNEPENYVHRIGRTARAGKTGKAITLASEQDVYQLPGIERYVGRKIPSENATVELLSEDKSEGKNVHTDFHEERERKKSRSRPPKTKARTEGSPDQKPTDHLREHPQNERKRGRKPGTRKESPPRSQKARTEEPSSGKPVTHRKKPRTDARNDLGGAKLSELSLEERMAYYKQKYDKTGSSKGKNTGDKKVHPKTAPQKEAGYSKKRKDKHNHEQAAENPAPPETTARENSSPENAIQKGFFSRLLGIFRKKED